MKSLLKTILVWLFAIAVVVLFLALGVLVNRYIPGGSEDTRSRPATETPLPP